MVHPERRVLLAPRQSFVQKSLYELLHTPMLPSEVLLQWHLHHTRHLMDAVIEASVFVTDCRDHHQRKDLSAQGSVRSHDLERDIVADLLRASSPRERLGYLHLLT